MEIRQFPVSRLKRALKRLFFVVLAVFLLFLPACGVWGGDLTAEEPGYAYSESGEKLAFLFEFRDHGSGEVAEEEDGFPHSTIDGELIQSWTVPCYGSTVYESVQKFFEDREDSVSFRLTQHRYYMFRECKLSDGREFNLETVYVAADGKYAMCANFQTLFGADGKPGTSDDLKTLTIVYKGWIY